MDEDTQDTNTNETPPEYSEVELKALDMGWRPMEEFNGSEDEFIDAKEFVRRKPLFDKIDTQNRTIKNVSKALEALKVHYTRVEQVAVEKAIATMKQQRKAALSEGDGEQFELLDTEIEKAEKQLTNIERVKATPLVEETVTHPDWESFVSRNSWYNTTGYMRAYADTHGAELAQQGLTPAEVLKAVEQAVRKEFPHKFQNVRKQAAPDTGGSNTQSHATRREDDIQLTDVERKVMNDLVRQGVLTKEKYIADLKAIKKSN